MDERFMHINGFHVMDYVDHYLAVDWNRKKFACIKKGSWAKDIPTPYYFHNLLDYTVFEDEISVTEGSISGNTGKTLVGAFVAGPLGAAAGAAGGRNISSTTKTAIDSLIIRLYLAKSSILDISIISRRTNKNSEAFRVAQNTVKQIQTLLDKILYENKNFTIDAENPSKDVLFDTGEWRCLYCGAVNGKYSMKCSCGKFKKDTLDFLDSIVLENKRKGPYGSFDQIPDFQITSQVKKYIAFDEYHKMLAIQVEENGLKHYILLQPEDIDGFDVKENGELFYSLYKDNGAWCEVDNRSEELFLSFFQISQVRLVIYNSNGQQYEFNLLNAKTNKGSRWHEMALEDSELIIGLLKEICRSFSPAITKNKEQPEDIAQSLGKDQSGSDPFEEIKKYKELLDLGIISEAEFAVKKKELLNL